MWLFVDFWSLHFLGTFTHFWPIHDQYMTNIQRSKNAAEFFVNGLCARYFMLKELWGYVSKYTLTLYGLNKCEWGFNWHTGFTVPFAVMSEQWVIFIYVIDKEIQKNWPITISVGFEGKWFAPVSPLPEILLGTTADFNTVIFIGMKVW